MSDGVFTNVLRVVCTAAASQSPKAGQDRDGILAPHFTDGKAEAPIGHLLLKVPLLQHTLPGPQFTVYPSRVSWEMRSVFAEGLSTAL